jgi:hypothetical protein
MTIEADNFRYCVKKLEIRLKLADEQIKLKDSLLEQYRDAFQKCTCRKGEPIEKERTWDHEKQEWR